MKKLRRGLIIVLLAGVLIHLWCAAQLDTEDWLAPSSRVPEAFDGFRVTLLTDLHGTTFGDDSKKLLTAVEAACPDLIAISGDLMDEWSDPEDMKLMLTKLAQIAPACYVTGNHEWARDDTQTILALIADCGITVLRDQWYVLERDGQSIVIAGKEDRNGFADQMEPSELVQQIRKEVPTDPYILMLYHRNDDLALWAQQDVDLVLAGHGHGGVVRLPFVGGLIGVDRSLFPDDCEGIYQDGRTTLAVSRGLGGLRIWNSPHLPTVVLKTQAESVNNS